ncbi:MAG: hypothetical protein IJ530_11645, partial [Treponema sp.]|nr:hypothetical protein [Treponema sp.]
MTETERKFYQNSSKSWLSAVRSMETRGKKQLLPSNGNLYHYAGNNPVTYVDPTGREDDFKEDIKNFVGIVKDEFVIGYKVYDMIANNEIHFDLEDKIKNLFDNNSYDKILTGAGLAGSIAGGGFLLYKKNSKFSDFVDGAIKFGEDLQDFGFSFGNDFFSRNITKNFNLKLSLSGNFLSIKNNTSTISNFLQADFGNISLSLKSSFSLAFSVFTDYEDKTNIPRLDISFNMKIKM